MQERGATRLLVVTNKAEDINSVERASAKWACLECRYAATLAKALEYAALGQFDVVLLSLNLPDSSGIKTLERFRRGNSSIPVVVLTDRHDDHVRLEALRHGALMDLVRGEFSAHMLAQSIRFAVVRARAMDLSERHSFMGEPSANSA